MKIKYKKLLNRIIPFLSCVVFILPFILLPVSAASNRIDFTKVNYWRFNMENTGSYYFSKYTTYQTRWSGDEETASVNLKWGGGFNWWYLSNRVPNTVLSSQNKPWFYQNVLNRYMVGPPFGIVNDIANYDTGLSEENILMATSNTIRPQLKSGERYTLQFTYKVEFPSSNTLGKHDVRFFINDVWDIDQDQNFTIIQPGTHWVLYDEFQPDDTTGTVFYDFTAPADMHIDAMNMLFDYDAQVPNAPFPASTLKNQVRITFTNFVISEYLFVDPVAGINSDISSKGDLLKGETDDIIDNIFTDHGVYLDDYISPITIAELYPFRETLIFFNDFFGGLYSALHLNIVFRIALAAGIVGMVVGIGAVAARRYRLSSRFKGGKS